MQKIQEMSTILGFILSLTSVLGVFTAIINKTFSKKLKPIEDRLEKDEKTNLSDKMTYLRFEIVSFAGELRRGVSHTRYEYDTIFKYINDYDEAVEKLNIVNHLFEEEVIYIKEKYRELDNK